MRITFPALALVLNGLLLSGLMAAPALSDSLQKSPRPPENPRLTQAAPAQSAAVAPSAGQPAGAQAQITASGPALPRPKPRPEGLVIPASLSAAAPAASAPAPVPAPATAAAAPGPRPEGFERRPMARPAGLKMAAAAPAGPPPQPRASETPGKKGSKPRSETGSKRGSVCGVAAIKGEKIAPITSKVKGCGLADGVRVTSVSGVKLSIPATIDCTTAKALNRWVESVAQPAYGGQIVELRIAGHYVCRPRNNKNGAKVSEHGRGRAIDISGFRLASGKIQPVLGGFDKTMRKAHRGACGIFGTTLGPGSDGFHEDHLHFDTARHRSGSYCR